MHFLYGREVGEEMEGKTKVATYARRIMTIAIMVITLDSHHTLFLDITKAKLLEDLGGVQLQPPNPKFRDQKFFNHRNKS